MTEERGKTMNREKLLDAFAVDVHLASRPDAMTRYEDDCRAIDEIKERLKQIRLDLIEEYRARWEVVSLECRGTEGPQ
jgi:hypothetical protein